MNDKNRFYVNEKFEVIPIRWIAQSRPENYSYYELLGGHGETVYLKDHNVFSNALNAINYALLANEIKRDALKKERALILEG